MSDVVRALVYAAAPSSAPVIESAIRGVQSIYTYLENEARVRNSELCELLCATSVRLESELYKGRKASKDWAMRFESLCERIRAYVEACERKHSVAAAWCALRNSKKVAKFKHEIDDLIKTMTFGD